MVKLYLGGDVSKGYADWTLLNEQKKCIIENFQLDDAFDGHSHLFKILKDLNSKHSDLVIYSAVESTGGYENNWYDCLCRFQNSFNIKVARVNPLGVNFNKRAGLERNTTGAISARYIAEYLITHPENVKYNQDVYWTNLRRHWNFVELQKKQRTQTINHLETLLYSANPTLMRYKDDSFPNWLLELIVQCPTASELACAKPGKLSKIPYLTQKRATKLILEAKTSVASATDKNASLLIRQIAIQIKMYNETIKSQMKLINDSFKHPDIEILKTFKGIDESAVGLLLEIGVIERFADVKQICCYFGLHPVYKISGDGIGGIKMSKQGSSNMRKILFNIAKVSIVHNPLIKELYERKVALGMKKMAALGVCMHKILRIIYGMLKHKQPFSSHIDKQNQERSKKKQEQKKEQFMQTINKSRRYQRFDSNAPVSRRQNKKRKEYEMSQSGNKATENGINHIPLLVNTKIQKNY